MTAANPPIQPRLMTLEDYKALPEGPPYFEFEEGKLIPMVTPSPRHQDVVGVLWGVLWQFSADRDVGRALRECEVLLPDGRAYIPDICYLSKGRLTLLEPDGRIHGSPDLAVEVTPSRPSRDRVRKFEAYFDNGVPWYWIIDPEALDVEEYAATPDGYVRKSGVTAGGEFKPALFPGLAIDLAKLLRVTPPAEAQ